MRDQNFSPASRRAALKTGLAVIAAAGVAGIAAIAKAETTKVTPVTVGYQTKPSNGQQCSGCVQFAPPDACKLVSGTISPGGWCKLYAPKGA